MNVFTDDSPRLDGATLDRWLRRAIVPAFGAAAVLLTLMAIQAPAWTAISGGMAVGAPPMLLAAYRLLNRSREHTSGSGSGIEG